MRVSKVDASFVGDANCSRKMSRAAASTAKKGAQKAAIKEKNEIHAADLAMGMTKDIKKLMAADTLLCMCCKATQLGGGPGGDKCTCPGGKQKPPADYDCKAELCAAAIAREEARKKAVKGQSAAAQSPSPGWPRSSCCARCGCCGCCAC